MSLALDTREAGAPRRNRLGTGAISRNLVRLRSLMVLTGALVVINLIPQFLPPAIDLTRGRFQTLAPQTLDTLHKLQQPVEISIVAPGRPRTVGEQSFAHAVVPFRDLIERCRRETPWLMLRILDPDVDLAARKLEEDCPDLSVPGVVVSTVVAGIRRHESLHSRDLAEFGATHDRRTVVQFFGEQALTASLARLIAGVEPTIIACLTGHGELSPDDDFSESRQGLGLLAVALKKMGCQLTPLDLSVERRVPPGTQQVLIAGPQSELKAHEIEALRRYLGEGGRALILLERPLDPLTQGDSTETLAELLAEYGVVVGRDRLVTSGFTGEIELASPVMPATADHSLVRALPLAPVIVQEARSIRQLVGVEPLSTVTIPLLVSHSSPRAWGETDLASSAAAFDSNRDLPGPVSVAVAVERHQGDRHEPVLVVTGDAEFANNHNLSVGAGRPGAAFLLEAIRWLRGNKELLADIPPQHREAYRLSSTPRELQRVVWLSTFLLCAALGVMSLTTWIQRRA